MRLPRLLICLALTSTRCYDSVTAADATAEAQRTIGIDIDESFVSVGVFKNGRVDVLKNDQGIELTPCYVALSPAGRRVIGNEAKLQLTSNPQNTVFAVFPLLGRGFDDPAVQNHIKRLPYRVYNRNGQPAIEFRIGDNAESYAPEEIVAMLLKKMIELAESHLNETVTDAVVSIPGCFSYVQLQAMRDAGRIAGLNAVHIVLASVAAGVAYRDRISAGRGTDRRILSLGVGNSCTEASFILIKNSPSIEMESHGSLRDAGGEQLLLRVRKHVTEQLERMKGASAVEKIRQSWVATQRLYREVERGARSLSTKSSTSIEVESMPNDQELTVTLTKSQFVEMNAIQLKRMMKLARDTVKSADRQLDDLQDVLLFGGATSRLPGIREAVEAAFSKVKILNESALDPDLASVIGAAFYAGQLDGAASPYGHRFAVLTVCPRTFGYRTAGGAFRALLRHNEIVPNSDFDSAPIVDLQVYEKAGDGSGDLELIGRVAIDPPPTPVPDVLITFKMEKFFKLNVSLFEMMSGQSKTVAFDHGLSAFKRQKMYRRLRAQVNADRVELERTQVRDDLESLAYRCLTKRPADTKEAQVNSGTKSDNLTNAEAAALGILDWLETAGAEADVKGLLARKRDLESALCGEDPPTSEEVGQMSTSTVKET